MACYPPHHDSKYLRALVDMGSNGIRFSITDLSPPLTRTLPTLHQSRAGISLYDAQRSSSGALQPISDVVIEDVVRAFKRFARTCSDFGVPDRNIEILATEATRTAPNSEHFRARIRDATGWEVKLLGKGEEGRVGALGIGSSLPEVSGLVMDLGGGSTQLSWLIKKDGEGEVQMPEGGAVSLPFGAAALSRRLGEAEKEGSVGELEREVATKVKEAYETLQVPEELKGDAEERGGFTLYLSGGGFRGWGYILLSRHRISPYPIPAINGFSAPRSAFLSTDAVKATAQASLDSEAENADGLFRVSERRATQVPAVAFLIRTLSHALPQVRTIRFCQGGVREGHLFASLPVSIRAQNPLVVATAPYASAASSAHLPRLLASALPPDSSAGAQDDYKSVFTPALMQAFANLMYIHASHPKDLQATAALRSTTSGVLAGVHGLLHESRALLALLLCARYGSEVPPSDAVFRRNLEALVESPWTLWWVNYLGAVAGLVAEVYPAGVVEGAEGRVGFEMRWEKGGKGKVGLGARVGFARGVGEGLEKEVKGIEKVGKRKRWIGGREGVGYKIDVDIVSGEK